MDLRGRVVVITGASRGLGAGMAEWFGQNGAALGLCARQTPSITGTAAGVTRPVDVSDAGQVDEFAAEVAGQLGPPDLWVNNAGVLEPIAAQRNLTSHALAEHLAVNVGGVLNGTRAFLRQLDAHDHRGVLVNVSSGFGKRGGAGVSAYSAGKAAVDRLTEVVALEEPDRLTMALAMSPGIVETGMQELIREQDEDVFPRVDEFRRFKELGAFNSPAWVARVLAGWVFGGDSPEDVLCRVPPEPGHG